MNITVLGAGAWGTALARILVTGPNRVTLWGRDEAQILAMRDTLVNERHLPGVALPPQLHLESQFRTAVAGADVLVLAVPSRSLREVAEELQGFNGAVVSVTKGIEFESGLTMCGVLASIMPDARIACLSGPSLADEVARDVPTAIVAASANLEVALEVQKLFHRPTFRVYTSTDLQGVELGGALKNVIAIAAGVGDGLGFGDNSKAALVTRSIVEIKRLGVACGAQPETFSGLSGLGDLMVTCFSKLSRNRGFGEKVGRGIKPEEILAGASSVVEGYPTTQAAWSLARTRGISTPIIDEVYAMLYLGKNVREAVRDLTTRDSKAEG